MNPLHVDGALNFGRRGSSYRTACSLDVGRLIGLLHASSRSDRLDSRGQSFGRVAGRLNESSLLI
jgi:hypothetical protein